MSIHSDLLGPATELLTAVQGDVGAAAPVEYQPPGKPLVRWEGSSIGAQHGGVLPQDDGSLLKVVRLPVQGPTTALVAGGVTELERTAVVKAIGFDWSIDLDQSHFGVSMVRLFLYRRPIARHDAHTQNER